MRQWLCLLSTCNIVTQLYTLEANQKLEKHSGHANVFSDTTTRSIHSGPTRHTEPLQAVLPHSERINTALRDETPLQLCACVCVCVVVGKCKCGPSVDTVDCVLLLPTSA